MSRGPLVADRDQKAVLSAEADRESQAALEARNNAQGQARGVAQRAFIEKQALAAECKAALQAAEHALRKFDLLQDVQDSFDPAAVVGSAVALCPQQAASIEALTTIAQRLTAGTDRAEVIKAIRDVDNPLNEERPYSGYLHATDVDENRQAFETARKIMQNAGVDAVLGLERGGKLLTETALAGMGEPRPVLETIAKPNVKTATGEMVRQMTALVDGGKRSLAMVDVNMGGGSLNWMKAQAAAFMEQLRSEGRAEGVSVTIIMLSEQYGFPGNVQEGVSVDPNAPPGVDVVKIPVRFVGGDDVDRIAGDDQEGAALGVFDEQGHAAPIPKDDEHGRTPREQFVKLMNPGV